MFLTYSYLSLSGQTNMTSLSNNSILYQLEWILESGNHRNLRDIASFLDDDELGHKALQILNSNTIFPKELIDLSTNPGKEKFFEFYYNNEKELKFSYFLEVFYIEELQNLKNQISVEHLDIEESDVLKSKLCFDIRTIKDNDQINSLQENISKLQLEYGYSYNEIYPCISKQNLSLLNKFSSSKVIHYVFPEEQFIDEHKLEKNSILYQELYTYLKEGDPLNSEIDRMIGEGYPAKSIRSDIFEKKYNLSSSYFYTDVDFFGNILCLKKENENKKSIISSLLQTRDPKLLYYLAAYNFKLRKQEMDINLIKLISNLSHIKIGGDSPEEIALNTLIFWNKNYANFEWDKSCSRFISQEEKELQTDNLEKLIRRLNSKNDSVAVASYRQLSKGDPVILEGLLGKYRNVMDKINSTIPSLKHNFLETLSKHVDYCMENKLVFETDLTIGKLLDKLSLEINESSRYKLENKILDNLNLNNVASVEYWAILRSKSKQDAYSAGRILDIFYSRNWKEILSDVQLFKNYVHTAILFKNLDSAGSCKNYHKKFKLEDPLFIDQVDWLNSNANSLMIRNGLEEIIAQLKEEQVERVQENTKRAFKTLFKDLKESSSIGYKDFNELLEFPEALNKERETTLSLIAKISPQKDIRKLALKEDLDAVDKIYFEEIDLERNELASIIRFFTGDKPDEVIKFILEKSAHLSLEDQAYLANSFFRNTWFLKYITYTKSISQGCSEIIVLLTDYLLESDFISEVEDRKTQLNIILISMIGMELSEKLRLSIEMDIDQSTRAELQKNIVAKMNYEDLEDILYFVDGLIDKNGHNDISFFHKDFGIPVFAFNSVKEINQMRKAHQELSEKEFYIKYLTDFGVDFTTKKGKLDYKKISEILNYDIAYRFVGKGGGSRDYFVYGIIKILEKQFKTTLGHDKKLNENQTFYRYTSTSRAKDWIQYLIENGYLDSDKLVPSFYN